MMSTHSKCLVSYPGGLTIFLAPYVYKDDQWGEGGSNRLSLLPLELRRCLRQSLHERVDMKEMIGWQLATRNSDMSEAQAALATSHRAMQQMPSAISGCE